MLPWHVPRQVWRLRRRNRQRQVCLRLCQRRLSSPPLLLHMRQQWRNPLRPRRLHRPRLPLRQSTFHLRLHVPRRLQGSRLRRVLRRERQPEFVRSSPAHNLQQRDPLPELQLRLHGLQFQRGPLCQRVATADRFRAPFQAVSAPAARVLDNRCARSLAKVAGSLLRVKVEDLVASADREEAQADPGLKELEQCPAVRVPARVHPGARACCRRFPTRCRPRRSRESHCTRAGRHNGSGRWSTSARWKASASCILRASVLVQAAEALRRWRQLRQSRVRPAR